MKKIKTTLVALFVFSSLNAQDNFTNAWDSIFRHVKEIGSLNTGYFWELSIPDSSLYNYNGRPDDSMASFEHWSVLCQQFQNSAIDVQNRNWNYEAIETRLQNYFTDGIIGIPILHAEAGKFNRNAIEVSAIEFDSLDYAWKLLNPLNAFYKKELFIASPYVTASFKSEYRIIFSDELIISNTNKHIKQISIRLRDESFREIPMNIPYDLVLLPGENELIIRCAMDNGEILESKTIILFDIRDLSGGVLNKRNIIDPFNIGDKNGNIYAEPQKPTELQDKLGAFIDYLPGISNGKNHTCIEKPILIIEGIDFGFENHPTGFYGGKCGNLGLLDLKNGYILNPYESNAKKRIEYWDPIKNSPQFLSALRNKGYDVFYIDFHNGAEYMENNAMLVVKCIQLLNQLKCSDEELVVVGASMGGVVGRYALNYMEKNNMPHCVRTYLSFDAPQSGANIPLGLQVFMKYFSGKLPTVKETFKRKIDRAATRELLLYHCNADYRSAPHKERNEFIYKLKQLGNYPLKSRNIALTNGSINRSFQSFSPGDLLFAMNPISVHLDNNPLNLTARVYAMVKYFPIDRYMVMELNLPLYQHKIFEVDDVFCPDQVPGSIRYDLEQTRHIYGIMNFIPFCKSACFIPTYSALDIQTVYVSEDIVHRLDPKHPDPKKYPFQTYYGVMNTNEEHMMMTNENISWVLNEIEKNRNEMPSILNSKYNFGRFERYTLRSVSIGNNGIVQINGNDKNGFGNGPYDEMNVSGSTFEMFTSDCNPLIIVDDGGSLVLGDNNGPNNNKSILRIKKGSVLMIKSGGTLKIHDGSQLIIEDGAELQYLQGAIIKLEGNSAQLQIDGKLRLEANAVFSIQKGDATHTGFVKLRNAKGGYGNASLEIGGANTSIDLKGTSSSYDVVLQVEGEFKTYETNQMYKLKSIKISNCKVMYGNKSSILTNSDVTINDVVFDKLDWANKGSSDAFSLNDVAKAEFNDCAFKNLNAGIKASGTEKNSNTIDVYRSKFSYCTNGINAKETKLYINACVYEYSSENGVYFYNPETDYKMENTRFTSNVIGCNIINKTGKTRFVFTENCDFTKNEIALYLFTCHSAISCSRFMSNVTALFDELGELSIGHDAKITGDIYSNAGGDNTFGYNSGPGVKLNATLLFMVNGYNNFLQENSNSNCNYLSGEIAYSTNTHQNSPPYYYNAANNYWSPAPSGSLQNGVMTHYLVKFPYPGSGSTLNYFSGSMLTDINSLCFDPNACNPCDWLIQPDHKYMEKEFANRDTFEIKIMPYPVSETLHLDIAHVDENSVFTLKVISIDGKVLYQSVSNGENINVPTSDWADGIYIIEASNGTITKVSKFILNHP